MSVIAAARELAALAQFADGLDDLTGIADFLDVPMGDWFDVPPDQASDYFSRKGLRTTWSYADMLGQEHDRAFTVAKMMDVDMLGQVRDSLQSALANGVTFRDWSATLTPILKQAGWWGEVDGAKLGSPWRLETIFRTNMLTAYAVGQWGQIVSQADIAPYLMYDAVDDHRTRPLHHAWDGKVLPVVHPWWRQHMPPNGYNSVVPDQRVSGNALLGLKAWYSGKVVEVIGDSSGRFTVTAQHPVLTTRGWVDAQDLNKGDELVSYRSEVGSCAMPADANKNHAPPTIEQVFNSLAAHARASVPRAALNLNGDSVFFEGDVEVVGADRELVERVEAATLKFSAEVNLLHASKGECLGIALRSLVADLFADLPALGKHGSRIGDGGNALGAILESLGLHRIRFDPIGSKVTSDLLSTLSELFGDVAQRHPAFVEANGIIRDWFSDLRALHPAQPVSRNPRTLYAGSLDAGIANDPVGSFGVNADAASDIIDRHSGSVQLDRVSALIFSDYNGHVYDLQTVSGTIALYGGECKPHYVVSNCRCGTIQLDADQLADMGLSVSEPPEDGTYRWINPRTGRARDVPNGIDPGFDRNAGADVAQASERDKIKPGATVPEVVKTLAQRVRQMPAESRAAVSQAMAREHWSRFDALALAFVAGSAEARLAAAVAAYRARFGDAPPLVPGLSALELVELFQAAVARGVALPPEFDWS